MSAKVKVKFGNVNLGEDTARLGIKIDRTDMKLVEADELFGGSRCNVQLDMTGANEDDGQAELEGMPDKPPPPSLTTVADIKGFNTKQKSFTAGLTISLSEVSPADLAPFAQQKGILMVERVGDIPKKQKRKPANPAPAGAGDDEGSTA